MSQFAVNLIRYRGEKDWTQQDLADKSGVSRATIGVYECGKRQPKYKSLVKLAKALGCTVPDLHPDYDQMATTPERDKYQLLRDEIERLTRQIDKTPDYNYTNKDSLIAEGDAGYGISQEARYIATEWDKLPADVRRRILTEIVNNRYEGEDDAKNSGRTDKQAGKAGT